MAAKIDKSKPSSTALQNPKSRNDNLWSIAGPDIVPNPEFDPDSVHEYLSGKGDEGIRSSDLKLRIRQHLASVGWIIEYFRESGGKGMIRMRYTSPEGKVFMSLVLVCKTLLQHNPPVSLHEIVPVSVGNNSLAVTDNEPVFYEPVCNHEALLDYVSIGEQRKDDNRNWYRDPNVKDIQLKVRMHLSFLGWRFWYSVKNNKRELRYCSPRGRIHISLVAACRQCMNERVIQHDRTRKRDSRHLIRKKVRQRNPEEPFNPQTILSWLIDNKIVLPRARVRYFSIKDNLYTADGRITPMGIHCACCGGILSFTKFEAHAGSTSHRAAANIFLEDGRSLLECQIQLRNQDKKKSKGRPRQVNDSICSVCQLDGKLILCDKCFSSYHFSCLGLEDVPDGDWFCPSCCCGFCGRMQFSEDANGLNNDSFVHCEQCQHNYHIECLKEMTHADPGNVPMGNCFCSKRCEDICLGLASRLGKCIPVGPVKGDLTWTLWKGVLSTDGPDKEVESYSKLNVAVNVMHECFEPLQVHGTKRDVVKDVIFCQRSELNRLSFEGFFTVLLEKNDELVSVANVRIHGEKVAELPLIATMAHYRKKGMCRILMNELEKMLKELGIQRLVLPAVSNALDTWKSSFGFSEMEFSEKLMYLNNTFLDFEGTTMCVKLLRDKSSENKTEFSHERDVRHLAENTNILEFSKDNQVKDSRMMDNCIPHQDVGPVVPIAELGVHESQFEGFPVFYKRRCMFDNRRHGLVDTTQSS